MRQRSHVPPIELIPSPFKHEFSILQLRAAQRRTLNFELGAEAHFESRRLRETDIAIQRFAGQGDPPINGKAV